MRQSLFWHLAGAIGRGEVARLGFAALRAGAAHNGLDLAEDWRGPLLATFAITWRCPLACAMCSLPARAGREIPDAEIPSWIDAIADLRPLGLGITGGEPLVRKALLPALERAARHGLVTHLNTSGVGLNPDLASRLAATGLGSVNVSIDHPEAIEHDRLRGRTGALEKALDAVSQLATARASLGARFRLQVMMAVETSSLPYVAALRSLVLERGADALSLLPIHDFLPQRAASLDTPADPTDRAAAWEVPEGLENSKEYLAGIAPFLAGGSTPGTCSAPRTAIFVDPTGDLYCCTPGATLGAGGVPSTPSTLGELVRRHAAARTTPHELCNRCWWNCHRELDIALGARPIIGP